MAKRMSFVFRSFSGFFVSFLVASSVFASPIRLLVPGSVQTSAVDPTLKQGRVPFERLQKGFDHARGLEMAELKGWYTGRCYFADSPTRPVASLLAVDFTSDQKANGPAFSSRDYRHVIPLIKSDAEPDYFDAVSSKVVRRS